MTIETFSNIDELVEVGQRMGFSGGGTQLKPGPVEVNRRSHAVGGITVVRHGARGAVEYWGDTPDRLVTFIVPLCFECYRVNLESPTVSRDVVMMPPGAEIVITTFGHDSFLLYVPVSLLARHLGEFASVLEPSPRSVRRFAIDRDLRAQLIGALMQVPATLAMAVEARQHVICEILAAMLRADADSNQTRLRVEAKRRALRRARDFIVGNIGSPLVVSEVSSAAGVSERTLQRLFNEEFQQGPLQYIRAQRLEAVRKMLSHVDFSYKSISEIAIENGFTHLGRFSTAFKSQFGALPKQFRRGA
ncbi:MAG: helix-turn-helix transcriptional regulator [Pseudomonadota bacterium]